MAVKIQYHFKVDPQDQYNTCVMTHKQYDNFRVIPMIDHCIILKIIIESSEGSSEKLEDVM